MELIIHALAPDEIKTWVRNWISNKTRCNYLSLSWSNSNYIGKRKHISNIFEISSALAMDRFRMIQKMLQTCYEIWLLSHCTWVWHYSTWVDIRKPSDARVCVSDTRQFRLFVVILFTTGYLSHWFITISHKSSKTRTWILLVDKLPGLSSYIQSYIFIGIASLEVVNLLVLKLWLIRLLFIGENMLNLQCTQYFVIRLSVVMWMV